MPDRTLAITCAINFNIVKLVEVSLRCGGQQQDLLLSDGRPSAEVRFETEDGSRALVEYHYRAFLADDVGGQRTCFESEWIKTDASVVVLDPRELYQHVRVGAFGVFDVERFASVFVDVRLDSPATEWSSTASMQLTPDRPELWNTWITDRAPVDVTYRLRHVTRAGEVLEGPWQVWDGSAIVATNPTDTASTPPAREHSTGRVSRAEEGTTAPNQPVG